MSAAELEAIDAMARMMREGEVVKAAYQVGLAIDRAARTNNGLGDLYSCALDLIDGGGTVGVVYFFENIAARIVRGQMDPGDCLRLLEGGNVPRKRRRKAPKLRVLQGGAA